jgi:alkyldihydroxyacetonephosphate synthase
MISSTQRRWYGWGLESVTFDLEHRPNFWPFLEQRLGISHARHHRPVDLESVPLREPRLDADTLERLRAIAGAEGVSTARRERVTHSMGMSYPDCVRLRQGVIPTPPDAVVFPESAEQVASVLRLAEERHLTVVPFGGGSSVVGGVEPEEPEGCAGVLSLDLRRIDRVIAVDPLSRTATIEAGMYGPALEDALNVHGFTLGHFPQSFEFSTLGGWIAARSAGQKSTRYGKIEEMVVALEIVTPRGLIHTAAVPASAAGPSLKQVYAGSEGTLGVITQATLRVHPLPQAHGALGVIFRDFASGATAVRETVQAEVLPAMLRLSDEDETASSNALRAAPVNALRGLVERAGLGFARRLGYSLDAGCLLLAACEGSRDEVAAQRRAIQAAVRRNHGFSLGAAPVHAWERERFYTPYLRDTLLDHGVLIETLETATLWDNLLTLHTAVKRAIAGALTGQGGRALVLCHISHVYRDGASLYFTFLAPQTEGAELEQWLAVKQAALETIVTHGGTISHHHGVGHDHRAYLAREIGAPGLAALRAVKHELDPAGVMNPGKVMG